MKPIFKKTILPIILIGFLFAIDLATKYVFFDLEFAKNFFLIEPMFNLGVSWSIPVPSLISIVIALAALVLFSRSYYKKTISRIVAVFLIAGTLGNLFDRAFLGGVRDFLMIGARFPVFNLADVFLNLGIIIYLRKEFFTGKNKLKQ